MIKRVRKCFKNGEGISFKEVKSISKNRIKILQTKDFFQFLYHIEDVDMALHFHRMAGQAISAPLLKK